MANVLVYSTNTCPFCIKVKQFFKENSVEFKEFDVSADQARAQEMIQKSGQTGVPVIDVDGEIVVGYDVARLKELLKLQ